MKFLRLAALAVLCAAAVPALAGDVNGSGPPGAPSLLKPCGAGHWCPATVPVDSAGAPLAGPTAAGQATELASLATLVGKPAGTAAAPIFVAGNTVLASASFTTPAGTTAYASGGLIANSGAAGSVAPMAFTVCRTAGGTGMVRRGRIKSTDMGFGGQNVRLHLYRDSPVLTNGDHAAWLTTEANYLGAIDVTFDKTFSDQVKGIGVPNAGSEINFDCAAGSQVIYGLVEARGAITPQGGKVMTVVLEVLDN